MSAPATTAAPGRAWRGSNMWLALLALVQIAVLVLVVLTVARPPAKAMGPLLGADVTPDKVVGIRVEDGDGNTIELKKAGVDWVLPGADSYPADGQRVGDFLSALTGLQRRGLVADTSDAYKRLEVADDSFQRKVTLTLDGGGTTTLLIGSEPSYGSTHLRVQGDQGVYLSHTLHSSQARTDASAWVKPVVVDLDKANVTAVTIHNAQGELHFSRSGDGWSLDGLGAGQTFDPQRLSSFLDRVTQLRLHAPLGKTVDASYGLDAPTATITLVTQPPAKASGSNAAGGNAGSDTSAAAATSSTPASGSDAAPATTAGAPGSSAPATTAGAPGSSASASAADAKGTAASNASNASNASADTATPTTTTITVGAKLDDGNYAVQTSTTPYVLSVSSYALGEAISKAQADFLVKPQTSSGN
jgi:hypothetical protein